MHNIHELFAFKKMRKCFLRSFHIDNTISKEYHDFALFSNNNFITDNDDS
jgi:hypothetical protein